MSTAYVSELEERWLNAMARIAELEAERDAITRRAIDDGAHDAIDAAAREDEREAMEPLVSRYAARIAELEAEVARYRAGNVSAYEQLEKLEAERDRLREALEPFVNEYSVEPGEGNKPSSDDLRRARAALSDSSGK